MSQDETTALDVFMADRSHPEWVEPAYEALKAERDELREALREARAWFRAMSEPEYIAPSVFVTPEDVHARGGDA